MATCKEWMKEGYLNKFWNGVNLEDEKTEQLEICGYRRLQQEWGRGELASWNGVEKKINVL